MAFNWIGIVRPSLVVNGDVTAIDLDALWQQGIRGFIFDLDNTVMAPHTGILWDSVTQWLSQLNACGFKSVILTNNKRADYCEKAGAVLNMPVIHTAAKPSQRQFRRAVALLELSVADIAVVGDRPLTDILGGQRLGAYTILVNPLTAQTEKPIIKLLRRLERSLITPPT